MKTRACALALMLMVFDAAAAPQGARLTYDASGLPVVFTRDAAGTYQVEGLPLPGNVLYVKGTHTVYYQHPSLPDWLSITPQSLDTYAVPANLASGGAWQPYMDAPTQRTQLSVADTTCGDVYGSVKAAAVAGLNAGDVLHVLAALQYINAGLAAEACDRLSLPLRQAETIGLPLRLDTFNGPWELTELVAYDAPHINLPSAPTPPSAEQRLHILLSQLNDTERAEFFKTYENLPIASQIEAVQRLLVESVAP